jgi:hypothetical protein
MTKHEPKKTIPQPPTQRSEPPTEEAKPKPAQHQGATEADVAPVTPPTEGTGDQGGKPATEDDEIDPTEELTPG